MFKNISNTCGTNGEQGETTQINHYLFKKYIKIALVKERLVILVKY